MSVKESLNQALKEAMRAREQKKLVTLRMIMAAIKQVEVDERIEVDDERLTKVILPKLASQRKDSIAQFEAAKRYDLVEQEREELKLIESYLPPPLGEAEIKALVHEAMTELGATKISDMGKVMAKIKPSLQGRADMSQVSLMIKNLLT